MVLPSGRWRSTGSSPSAAGKTDGGRVTGTYYLVRNAVVIPSAALGGVIWEGIDLAVSPVGRVAFGGSPTLAFALASAIGLVGTAYFPLFGEKFEAYA